MTPFNAKWHCLQCYFCLNFLPRLVFLYLSMTSYGNIDYYGTQTQNVIKNKSTTLLNLKDIEKPKRHFSRQIPIYPLQITMAVDPPYKRSVSTSTGVPISNCVLAYCVAHIALRPKEQIKTVLLVQGMSRKMTS